MHRVLLVEDNPGDVDLVRESFDMLAADVELTVARDGAEALRMLRREGEHAQMPYPTLVLLDLNLPRVHGREVLREVRRDPNLTHIPVVVLSSSAAESDVLEAYRLHANCYITKAADFDSHFRCIEAFTRFWMGLVALPTP